MYQRSNHKELENTAWQNLWDAAKAVVGGKLTAVMPILEKKDLKSITLRYGSRKIKEKIKVKENRKKEGVKIKVEIKTVLSR